MVSIFGAGPGLHHNFLRFTLDYLSRLTPEITQFPFDHSGAAHLPVNRNKNNTIFKLFINEDTAQEDLAGASDLCICMEADDILYFERAALRRESSRDIDLNDIGSIDEWHEWLKPHIDHIRQSYKINPDRDIPRFILRDSVKKAYLDTAQNGWLHNNQSVVKKVREKVQHMIVPVSSFFTLEKYTQQLKKINDQCDCDLDMSKLPKLYDAFVLNNDILQSHHKVFDILAAVRQNNHVEINGLDVYQEGYIYAKIEQENDFVLCPLTDNFFKSTSEIIDYLTYYPEHYKAMNPNLPKFNGIENPFFLHRQKTK